MGRVPDQWDMEWRRRMIDRGDMGTPIPEIPVGGLHQSDQGCSWQCRGPGHVHHTGSLPYAGRG